MTPMGTIGSPQVPPLGREIYDGGAFRGRVGVALPSAGPIACAPGVTRATQAMQA